MKIVVLGATGMLGHVVADHMASVYGEENVVRTCRTAPIYNYSDPGQSWIQLDASDMGEYLLHKIPQDADYVINCIGIIKPFIEATGIEGTLLVNSIFPHRLARYCNEHDIKLIHITTDCVYSGKDGEYTERKPHDITDVYGRTKSLGEPITDAMVLRTSIIGREIHKQASLVAWVQSQAGEVVNGYTNHWWNGVTTKTYAECCCRIIDNDGWKKGLFHIFSPTFVTKCELVEMISHALKLDVTVNPVEAPDSCDRTLSTDEDLCENLQIPELYEQLKGL